jgi:hypothetical protein
MNSEFGVGSGVGICSDDGNVVRFEVFTAVTMKNSVFWDVTPCGLVRADVWEELSA